MLAAKTILNTHQSVLERASGAMISITSGFQSVKLDCFRKKSLTKGRKLLESFHVSNVSEQIFDKNERRLVGFVLRETPGVVSERKNENVYKIIVELNSDRSIRDTLCNCKGGKGFCKHAAAVRLFVNEENTLSKTDAPMIWNRPSELQLEKYKKGCRIESLFECNNAEISRVFRCEDVEKVTDQHLQENSGFINLLKSEYRCAQKKNERKILALEKENILKNVLERLFVMQVEGDFGEYHAYEVSNISETASKFHIMKCPSEYSQYYADIEVDELKWTRICLQSVNQSESNVWYSERYPRITCSKKAHEIKTKDTEDKFGNLAQKFKNQKYNGKLVDAMRYGLSMEPVARSYFEELTNLKVYETGLVICVKQPYLACSPDGIIENNDSFQLLEIKCPYKCENTKVVDSQAKISFVPYLEFNDKGDIELKASHQYYTQIQISMYIIGAKTCHFFVYSQINYAYIKIERDEEFLSIVIPKIEYFYFKHFLPLLVKRL